MGGRKRAHRRNNWIGQEEVKGLYWLEKEALERSSGPTSHWAKTG
jgi:hypothetical protein